MLFTQHFFTFLLIFDVGHVVLIDFRPVLFDEAHVPGYGLADLEVVVRDDHPFRDSEVSQPSLEVDQAEDAIYNNDMTDLADILDIVIKGMDDQQRNDRK